MFRNWAPAFAGDQGGVLSYTAPNVHHMPMHATSPAVAFAERSQTATRFVAFPRGRSVNFVNFGRLRPRIANRASNEISLASRPCFAQGALP